MNELGPPPCVLHEDDDLLVVEKPPGWNTHSPAPFAGEGIYDWLRHREPRWACLAIIHRLDKETAGVIVFAKSPRANKSLTEQFTGRRVTKRYLLLASRRPPRSFLRVESRLVRIGERYQSRPSGSGDLAITEFTVLSAESDGPVLVEARPLTGRTHQIRVHAAEAGFPVLGDTLYGGAPAAHLALQAEELTIAHPVSGQPVVFRSRTDVLNRLRHRETTKFRDVVDVAAMRRAAMVADAETDCCRLIHGAGDDASLGGQHVDRWGPCLLCSVAEEVPASVREANGIGLSEWAVTRGFRAVYQKVLRRAARERAGAEASPQLLAGQPAAERFLVRENGVRYEVSFTEGYSVGLFLDQRDNRRRLLVNHVAAGFPLFPAGSTSVEVLNVFAYTCGFSVCAALAGARTTSLDLSRKYLDWGQRNFAANGLSLAGHDFIYGDAFDWLRRLAKRGRQFDAVLLDPPTFSTSKAGGRWQAERDYGRLVSAVMPLLRPGGVLFASTNTSRLAANDFTQTVRQSIAESGRSVVQEHFVPQPPDFPISKSEPAHLKTIWLRVS